MSIFIDVLLLMTAFTGTAVALSRKPGRQVLAISANGIVLSLLFMALQAPDVALAEIVVGAAALPLMFLVVVASTRMERTARAKDAR